MGKLSLRYFGPVVWETMLPEKFKNIDSLGKFENHIKGWIPECKCRLCKTSDMFHPLNLYQCCSQFPHDS